MLALALSASVAWADGPVLAEVLGWTADVAFAYVGTHRYLEADEARHDEATYRIATVVEPSGGESHYLLEVSVVAGTTPLPPPGFGRVGDAKRFDAWKAEHPLSAGTVGRTSADGATALGVSIDTARLPLLAVTDPTTFWGAWEGERYRTTGMTGGEEQFTAWYDAGLVANEAFFRRVSFDVPGSDRTGVVDRQVSAAWSPDGARVALLLVTGDRTLGQSALAAGKTQVVFAAVHPRIELVAHEDLRAEVIPPLEAALAAAPEGYALRAKSAQKARETSVIYARAGFEEVAGRLVGAVPGGAAIEVLDWTSGADLVVALGTSARPR